MNRRSFLKILGLATTTLAFTGLTNLEVIEAVSQGEKVNLLPDEIDAISRELELIRRNLPTLFNRDAIFFKAIETSKVQVVSNRSMRIPLQLKPGARF